jgi:hypothetical protein
LAKVALLDPLDTLASSQRIYVFAIFLKPLGHTGLAAVTLRLEVPFEHQMVLVATGLFGAIDFEGTGDAVTAGTDSGLSNLTTIDGSE